MSDVLSDDELLVMMVQALRREQAGGWVQVPPEHAAACDRLLARMLVIRNADGLVLPTKRGVAIAEHSSMTTGGRR